MNGAASSAGTTYMISRRRGHIVNIASIAGRSAFPNGTGYVTTKHAVLGFSESLMLEVREFGVKVSVVELTTRQ